MVILSLFVVLTSARNVPYFPPLSPDLVNYINKLNTTWKVSKFRGTVQLCRGVGIGSCLSSELQLGKFNINGLISLTKAISLTIC